MTERRRPRPTGATRAGTSTETRTMPQRVHAQRIPLGPFLVWALALVVGSLGHLADFSGLGWLFYALLGTATGVTALLMHKAFGDPVRKAYALVCLGASAAVALLVYETVEALATPSGWLEGNLQPLGQTLGLSFLGTLLLGVGWWTSEGKRTQVRVEAQLDSWEDIAGQFGMGKTKRVNVVRQRSGNEVGSLRWPAGAYTPEQVKGRLMEFEGAMGAERGTLRLIDHGRATNQVDYMIMADDPNTEAVEWPGVGPTEVSVVEPTAIGLDETGATCYLPDYIPGYGVPHALLAGSQGSGKSGGMNLHIATNACRFDAVQWGMDFKGGIELMPWRGVLDFFTRDVREALEMVTAIEAVIEDRARYMADVAGVRLWRPGAVQDPHGAKTDGPVLIVAVDEIKELLQSHSGGRTNKELNDIEDRMIRAATQGRAVGVRLLTATQNPTLEALRSSQFRDRLNQRVCYRTENAAHEQYIIPDRKVNAHLIAADRQGTAYVLDQDKFTGLPVRYFYIDDDTVSAIAAARTGGTPALDPVSAHAAARVSPLYVEQHPDLGAAPVLTPVREPVRDIVREPEPAPVVNDAPAPREPAAGPSLDAVFAHHERLAAAGALVESDMDAAHRIAATREGGRHGRAMRLLRERGRAGASAKALYTAAGTPEKPASRTWLYDEFLDPERERGTIVSLPEHGMWGLAEEADDHAA